MYRQVLAVRERLLGAEHPDTLTSLQNLGVLLRRQEKFEEAEEVYELLIQRWQHVDASSASSARLGSAWFSRARLEAAQQKWQEVLRCCERSWAFRKELHSAPRDAYNTLRLWSLAAAELGQWELARQLAEVASTQAEEIGKKEILEEAQQTLTQVDQRILPKWTT